MKKSVQKIFVDGAGSRKEQGLSDLKKVRVAVYARVSTDMEIQLASLEEQMRAFRTKIAEHPDWELIDVYADEGMSGTSVRKRKAFLQMISDCKAGKIDYVLTKSISRFARNTVECLSYVRQLQSYGVQILFEKERIDTGAAISEMMLTVLAAFAQEESRSISENLKWGLRKRFEQGVWRWTPTYGYRLDEEGRIVIEPLEAEIVRWVFEKYRRGESLPQILTELHGMHILSPRGGKWTKTTLQYLLQNEKYAGDMRLQKWVSIDHISHKSILNDTTKVPSFYVKNSHIPIINRHTFQQVQRIMELKKPHEEYSRYPYFDTDFICPVCGEKLIPRLMHTKSQRRALCCFGEKGCQGYAIKAYLVDAALLKAYNSLKLEDCSACMAEMKAEMPIVGSVQYYWLNDLVERVTFESDSLQVHWKNGAESTVPLCAPMREDPFHVAELYRSFLKRIQSGEYRPTFPGSTQTRLMMESVAQGASEMKGGENVDHSKNQPERREHHQTGGSVLSRQHAGRGTDGEL